MPSVPTFEQDNGEYVPYPSAVIYFHKLTKLIVINYNTIQLLLLLLLLLFIIIIITNKC